MHGIDLIIGKIKFITERQRGYAGWLNTIILIWLFFQKIEFKLWHLIFVPIYILFSWLDIKYIYPAERTYGDSMSGVLNDIISNTNRD
jgi:hypothetical protein